LAVKASPGSGAAEVEAPGSAAKPVLDPASVQYLLAEFGYFQSARAGIINDASARATLFMNSVAAGTVALALVAQLSGVGAQFLVFALVVLPTLLFLGVGTFRRLVDLNIDDSVYLVGLTRIRAYFHAANPAIARYDIFVGNDDLGSVAINNAQLDVPPRVRVWRVFVTTPGTIATICAVIAGATSAVLLSLLSIDAFWVAVVGVIGGLAMLAFLFLTQAGRMRRLFTSYRPRFPAAQRSIHPAFEDDDGRQA
jgi:hypothetical protein